jgi:DNA polymerase-3 subunit beta
MKFTIERDALTSALAQVRGIVKRANIIPILSCCKIEAAGNQITLTSTDMDMQASSTVHAEVETEGAIAIDAHALSDFVGRQPKGSIVAVDSDGKISCGRSRGTITPLPADDFPAHGSKDALVTFTLSPDAARHMLALPSRSAANDALRAYLCGVALTSDGSRLIASASDGKTMIRSVMDAKVEPFDAVIVPSEAIRVLAGMLAKDDITVEIGDGSIRFTGAAFSLNARLINGEPAAFDRIIPPNFERCASVDRSELMLAIDRVACLTSDKDSLIRVKLNGGPMIIESAVGGAKSAVEEIDVSYDGSEFAIGFNAKQLAMLVDCMPSETIDILMNEPGSPVSVHDEAHQGTTIIMPVRV